MWYESWQSGYDDILERGFPAPKDDKTILAELRSPKVGDFLHGGHGDVPFLVNDRTRKVFEKFKLTGLEFGPVVIAKIGTKGLRKREVKHGEPEDPILKSGGVSLKLAPLLHAIRITASVTIVPDYKSGRTRSGFVSPFSLPRVVPRHDLWRPRFNSKNFSAWCFCSERFKDACESSQLSDIKFETFDSFMDRFRNKIKHRR